MDLQCVQKMQMEWKQCLYCLLRPVYPKIEAYCGRLSVFVFFCIKRAYFCLGNDKHVSRDMTKTNKMRVRPAKTPLNLGAAKSDQSLRCLHEETLGPQLPIERTAKTLMRLGGCPDWSESSLSALSFYWFCHVAAHVMGYVRIVQNANGIMSQTSLFIGN